MRTTDPHPQPHLSTPAAPPRQPADTPEPDTSSAPPARRRRRGRRSTYGSVRRTSAGRWQARYVERDGTRRAAPVTFDTKRQAQDWLAAVRTDQLRGAYHSPDAGQELLADYAAEQLALRVDLAPSTLALYRSHLARWIATDLAHPLTGRPVNLGSLQLRQITPATVAQWHAAALAQAKRRAHARAEASDRHRRTRALHAARLWALDNGHQVAATGRLPQAVLDAWRAAEDPAAATLDLPATEPPRDAGKVQVAQAYRLLRTVLAAAHRDGLVPANPCTIRGAGVVKSRDRVPATVEDLDIIAAHMPARFAAAVHVAALSGLRAGELFALTRAHVNLTAGTVRVERTLLELPGQPPRFGPPKTTSSLRTVHLPRAVIDVLADHMAAHTRRGADALVFARADGSPLPRADRSKLFRAACAHAGRHDLRWHDLRHTGATLAAQAGASLRELQARLGHATVAAAMTYQHATAERDRAVAARMDDMLSTHQAPHLRSLPTGAAL